MLGPVKDEAKRQFHKLMGEPKKLQPLAKNSVAAIRDDFIVWTQENRSEKTCRGDRDFCDSFAPLFPELSVEDLSAAHVTNWLNPQSSWGSTTKRGAITCL